MKRRVVCLLLACAVVLAVEAMGAATVFADAPALMGVAFSNGTNGCAVGQGAILHTVDGGQHWVPATSIGDAGALYAVAFSDATHGCAVGTFGTIVRTVDGGQNWSPVSSSGTANSLLGIAFTDAAHGCAVGDNSTIVRTVDGGQHWSPAVITGNADELVSVAFSDATHGCAVGGQAGDSSAVMLTVDGGQHWSPASPSNGTYELLHAVAFSDATHGCATGYQGTIWSTVDAGQHWTGVVPPGTHVPGGGGLSMNLYRGAAFAPNSPDGCAVGDDGLVVSTVDGGLSWSPAVSAGTPEDLSAVAFARGSLHGCAVGLDGAIVRTLDGGQTWSPATIKQPVTTRVSKPSASPSSPKHGKSATFTSHLTPSAAAMLGISYLNLFHYETRTVTQVINGKAKKVRVTNWFPRGQYKMKGSSSGKLTKKIKLAYSGKWLAAVAFTGAMGYTPSSSGSAGWTAFTVK